MATVATVDASPFHAGEREIQQRLGIRDKIEAFGRRVIRDHMPDQHREFYAELPFVLFGTLDGEGRPWASIVAGRPGFLSTPDARTFAVRARPLAGDPLAAALRVGADVGVLGIQLETRRRNRLSGRITEIRDDGFALAVTQTFGNCPQYIQSRETRLLEDIDSALAGETATRSDRFDARTRALIETADTLFVATAYSDGGPSASNGADVSHRGGKPGFVKVEDDRAFVFPDFAGNYHFNTVGNILRNPKAGFLFVDFATGEVVSMTGAADVVWEGTELRAFVGAERLIRFRAETVIRSGARLPLRFTFGAYSPTLDHTGSWPQAAATIAADAERNVYALYEVVDIRPESDAITSFTLRRADRKTPASYEPGQYLPIRVAIPGHDAPALRTYTISEAPGGDTYRLSIKREADGLVSRHFHDRLRVGDRIEAMAPRGKFVLDRSSARPVVFLSAGVGITPMIAMLNAIVAEGQRTRRFRRAYFIHGARDGRAHAFADHLRDLKRIHDGLTTHIRYSHPAPDDRLGETHDSEGRVTVDLLKRILPFDDFDFYLCGPQAFMRDLFDGLIALGVREERIRYESFGPATVLRRDNIAADAAAAVAAPVPVKVRFAKSGIDAVWTAEQGTLLELAEANGIVAAFSCRSGICGTCATRLTCGAVDYIDEPSAPRGDGEVLICCATPRPAAGPETCGENRGVVLDL